MNYVTKQLRNGLSKLLPTFLIIMLVCLGANLAQAQIVSVGIIASSDTTCEDMTVTFDDDVVSVDSIVSYAYDMGDGSTLTTVLGHAVSHNYSTSGLYTVTLTVTDIGGNTMSGTHDIWVNPGFAVDAGPVISGCPGSTDTLHGTTSASLFTVNWVPSGGLSDPTIMNPIVTIGGAGSPGGGGLSTYLMVVTDDRGCEQSDYALVEPDGPMLNLTGTNPTCTGTMDGCIDGTVTAGGAGGYSYIFSTGTTTPVNCGLGAGMYYMSVTDVAGCTVVDSIELTEPNVGVSALAGCDSSLTVIGFGGVPGYEYSIDGGLTWQYSTASYPYYGLAPGMYTVMVRDANGCVGISTTATVVGSSTTFDLGPDTVVYCFSDTLVLNAGSGYDSYVWSGFGSVLATDSTLTWGATPVFPASGTISCVVTSGSCTFIDEVFVVADRSCVWPGDANHDGIADIYDILPVGIGYGATGTIRLGATTGWYAQPSYDWGDTLLTGANYKHIDTDGDGTIDFNDTVAISLNYGMMHPKGDGTNGSESTDPLLYVDMPDSIYPSMVINAPVIFGSPVTPVSNFYGVAFSLTYDNAIVDSMGLDYGLIPTWAGIPGVDMMAFSRDRYDDGAIDIAVVRTNGMEIASGSGQIGFVSLTLQDDISGKDFLEVPFIVDVVGVKAIHADGSEFPVFAKADTATAYQEILGIQQPMAMDMTIYPNPSTGVVYLQLPAEDTYEIQITDLSGKVVSQQIASTNGTHKLDISKLPAGTYLMEVSTDEARTVNRLVITK